MAGRVGKYLLFETLGEGSFGKVRLGVNEETGEQVAIKIMDKSNIKESEMTMNVRREIAIMKALKHKNIVNMHEVLSSKNKLYIVMDLVSGGELFDKILQEGKLEESLARRYFQQMVDGIEYCHRRGICHRDLKPENLLIDDYTGELKITDFGLSAMLYVNTAEDLLHTQCGSPNYVAPEVISSAKKGYNGQKVDTWSCGVILFALCAGYLPFFHDNTKELYRMIQRDRVRYPRGFPSGAKSLIELLLCKDPAKRMSLQDAKRHPWFLVDYEPEPVRPGPYQAKGAKKKKKKSLPISVATSDAGSPVTTSPESDTPTAGHQEQLATAQTVNSGTKEAGSPDRQDGGPTKSDQWAEQSYLNHTSQTPIPDQDNKETSKTVDMPESSTDANEKGPSPTMGDSNSASECRSENSVQPTAVRSQSANNVSCGAMPFADQKPTSASYTAANESCSSADGVSCDTAGVVPGQEQELPKRSLTEELLERTCEGLGDSSAENGVTSADCAEGTSVHDVRIDDARTTSREGQSEIQGPNPDIETDRSGQLAREEFLENKALGGSPESDKDSDLTATVSAMKTPSQMKGQTQESEYNVRSVDESADRAETNPAESEPFSVIAFGSTNAGQFDDPDESAALKTTLRRDAVESSCDFVQMPNPSQTPARGPSEAEIEDNTRVEEDEQEIPEKTKSFHDSIHGSETGSSIVLRAESRPESLRSNHNSSLKMEVHVPRDRNESASSLARSSGNPSRNLSDETVRSAVQEITPTVTLAASSIFKPMNVPSTLPQNAGQAQGELTSTGSKSCEEPSDPLRDRFHTAATRYKVLFQLDETGQLRSSRSFARMSKVSISPEVLQAKAITASWYSRIAQELDRWESISGKPDISADNITAFERLLRFWEARALEGSSKGIREWWTDSTPLSSSDGVVLQNLLSELEVRPVDDVVLVSIPEEDMATMEDNTMEDNSDTKAETELARPTTDVAGATSEVGSFMSDDNTHDEDDSLIRDPFRPRRNGGTGDETLSTGEVSTLRREAESPTVELSAMSRKKSRTKPTRPSEGLVQIAGRVFGWGKKGVGTTLVAPGAASSDLSRQSSLPPFRFELAHSLDQSVVTLSEVLVELGFSVKRKRASELKAENPSVRGEPLSLAIICSEVSDANGEITRVEIRRGKHDKLKLPGGALQVVCEEIHEKFLAATDAKGML